MALSEQLGRFASLGGALVLSACTARDPLAFVGSTWQEGELSYSARSGDPLACASALGEMARNRAAFAGFFGLPTVESAPLRYYKYLDKSDFFENADCPRGSSACFGDSVKSPLPVDYHELTHAWVRAGFDVRTRFASEGIASALSCAPYSRSSGGRLSLATGSGSDPHLDYHAAGRLTMRLLSLGTARDLIDWTERIDAAPDGPSAADAAAQDIYGEPLEQIWTEANEPSALPCFALGRCDAPLLPLGKTRLSASCTGMSQFVLSRELAPALALRGAGLNPDVLACAPGARPYAPRSAGFGDRPGFDDAEYLIEMPTEPHLLTLADGDPAFEAVLSARALPGAFAETCSLSEPISLSAKETRIVLPERPGTLFFPLAFEQPELTITALGDDVDGVELAWCPECDACAPVQTGTLSRETGVGVLRVTLAASAVARTLSLE